jgi:hypothetical protein
MIQVVLLRKLMIIIKFWKKCDFNEELLFFKKGKTSPYFFFQEYGCLRERRNQKKNISGTKIERFYFFRFAISN